jgi:hypothetical protein
VYTEIGGVRDQDVALRNTPLGPIVIHCVLGLDADTVVDIAVFVGGVPILAVLCEKVVPGVRGVDSENVPLVAGAVENVFVACAPL